MCRYIIWLIYNHYIQIYEILKIEIILYYIFDYLRECFYRPAQPFKHLNIQNPNHLNICLWYTDGIGPIFECRCRFFHLFQSFWVQLHRPRPHVFKNREALGKNVALWKLSGRLLRWRCSVGKKSESGWIALTCSWPKNRLSCSVTRNRISWWEMVRMCCCIICKWSRPGHSCPTATAARTEPAFHSSEIRVDMGNVAMWEAFAGDVTSGNAAGPPFLLALAT